MIDVNFDFQAESGGRDSDRYSPTLQHYHQVLWSKPLPSGKMFLLEKISGNRLHHKSKLGEFYLSSDRAIPTFTKWVKMKNITDQIPKTRLKEFVKIADTIGGIVVWPSNKVNNMPTINAYRGFNLMIADRLDITIECIRLYYLNKKSPLYETLKRYDSFFSLFVNFKGYTNFFLLQDFVANDYKTVKIAKPFDNFQSKPLPSCASEYYEYMNFTESLIKARNKRISDEFKLLTNT